LAHVSLDIAVDRAQLQRGDRIVGGADARRVGRYDILLPIASGGMATVYLARAEGEAGFEREVALKIAHPHLSEDPDFAMHLLEEAKLAVRIRHANVVPVLDAGLDSVGVYLVMEYIEGETMAWLQREARVRGGLDARFGLRILIDGLSGLHAAHELRGDDGTLDGVVHRDFSPQNVIVGLDGVARLTDFGIAKAITSTKQTATGVLKGKIQYMAPEQVKSEPLDRRCDIWAAGVVAWELLAQRRLFTGQNDAATLFQIVSDAPPLLRAVNPSVPPDLEAVVAAALRLKLDERTPTAHKLARELAAVAASHDMLATSEEVSHYVKTVADAKLRDRRLRAQEARSIRAPVAAPSPRKVRSAPPEAPPPIGPDVTATTTVADAPAGLPPVAELASASAAGSSSRARRLRPSLKTATLIAATAGALGGGILLLFVRSGGDATASPTPSAPSISAVTEAPPTASPPAQAASSAPEPAASTPTQVIERIEDPAAPRSGKPRAHVAPKASAASTPSAVPKKIFRRD
jgi:serine/threonine-protein kinase